MEHVIAAVMTDGGQTGATIVYKTVEIDMNLLRLLEDEVQLVSTWTHREGTCQSETETMSTRTPDLTGPLPPIARLTRTETVSSSTAHPSTARHKCQFVSNPTPTEERPGVNDYKLQRRRDYYRTVTEVNHCKMSMNTSVAGTKWDYSIRKCLPPCRRGKVIRP